MIIDSHVHVLKGDNFDKSKFEKLGFDCPVETPIDQLVDWLKGAGVENAIIMGQDMSRIWNSSCGEEYVLECLNKYPDFFMALASIEPVDSFGRFNKSSLDYFEKAIKEYGFKGVLLTPPYGRYRSNDPAVYPIYDIANELNTVVQFHHCLQPGSIALAPYEYVLPLYLNKVLIDFPELKVVVEHLNYPWYEELFFMMASDENVYADVAMNYDRPNILTWNLVKAKEFGVLDRIMYASDFWAPGQGVFSKEVGRDMKRWIDMVRNGLNKICRQCGWPPFTDEEIDGIMYKNAAKLYEIKS